MPWIGTGALRFSQRTGSAPGWPQDDLTPLDILGPPDHGGQGQRILCTSVQSLQRRDPRLPTVPHTIQRGHGRRHPPLGDSGGAN